MFEISLVPDVKAELLRKQRMRNFVILISILVAIGAVVVVLIIASIVGAQAIRIGFQDTEIACLSNGVKGEKDCPNGPNDRDGILRTPSINEYLTVQNQLTSLASISESKKMLSRLFGVLDVILPFEENVVSVRASEMSVNLTENTLRFDAQADDLETQIDYKALEIFKNTVTLATYDYGRYVDADGKTIPTMCISESDDNGVPYINARGQSYAIYTKGIPGCGMSMLGGGTTTPDTDDGEGESGGGTELPGVDLVSAERIEIVRDMTRTELEEAKSDNKPYFNSSCVLFDENGRKVNDCLLVTVAPGIRDSSNGRDSDGNLVLRFTATISLSPQILSFNSKHMRIIVPTKQNVTDSYIQIRNMFTERAADCAPEDLECKNNAENANGS